MKGPGGQHFAVPRKMCLESKPNRLTSYHLLAFPFSPSDVGERRSGDYDWQVAKFHPFRTGCKQGAWNNNELLSHFE